MLIAGKGSGAPMGGYHRCWEGQKRGDLLNIQSYHRESWDVLDHSRKVRHPSKSCFGREVECGQEKIRSRKGDCGRGPLRQGV